MERELIKTHFITPEDDLGRVILGVSKDVLAKKR